MSWIVLGDFPSNCDGNADMHKVGVLYHDGY